MFNTSEIKMLKSEMLERLEYFKEKKLTELLLIFKDHGIEAINDIADSQIKESKGSKENKESKGSKDRESKKWDLLLDSLVLNFSNNKNMKVLSIIEDYSKEIYNKIIENTNSDKIEINSCLSHIKVINPYLNLFYSQT